MCGPGHAAAVLVAPVSWRDRLPSRVGWKQPAGHGVVEDLPQQHVDFEDGLGRQPAGAVGTSLDEEVFVQVLDLFGPQRPQRYVAKAGEDVQAQLSAVPVEGDGAELALLSGQLGSFDVSGQGQAAAAGATTFVLLHGEPTCELFGLGTVGPSGVPPAALLAGGGVEPFVDDHVPAVVLPSDVALHHVSLVGGEARDRMDSSPRWRPGHTAATRGTHVEPGRVIGRGLPTIGAAAVDTDSLRTWVSSRKRTSCGGSRWSSPTARSER